MKKGRRKENEEKKRKKSTDKTIIDTAETFVQCALLILDAELSGRYCAGVVAGSMIPYAAIAVQLT